MIDHIFYIKLNFSMKVVTNSSQMQMIADILVFVSMEILVAIQHVLTNHLQRYDYQLELTTS